MASNSNIRKSKRKFIAISDTEIENSAPSNESSPKKSLRSHESPKSSPIKSPLVDNEEDSKPQSFVAKCFYGLKTSVSGKKDLKSPPRVSNKPMYGKQGDSFKIFRDPILNEKMLDRIANSPVKQAVLHSCSVEEFRRLYRDEIKELEHEDEVNNRRFTRSSSKIVYRRNNSDDEDDSDGDCVSFVDDEISFKISNRGFDVDSLSDNSSLRVQSPASLKDKDISHKHLLAKLELEVDEDDHDDMSSNCTESEAQFSSPSQETSFSSVPSSSERKFFKSKSVRDSINSGNVIIGKNFNLRFVSKSHSKSQSAQKKKKAGAQALKPKRLSLGDQSYSLSIQTNKTDIEKFKSTTALTDLEAPTFRENEFLDDLVVNKESKTYDLSSQKGTKDNRSDDLSSTSNSLPESEQVVAKSTTKKSPTESHVSSDEELDQTDTKSSSGDRKCSINRRLFPIFTWEKSSGISKNEKSSPQSTKTHGVKAAKDNQSQMIIDAGQKKFGATQCNVCGMVFCYADPMDEAAHTKFHNRLLEVLKFPGWKKGREVQEFPIDCASVVMIMSDDPKYCRKKVEEMYELMERDLGFPGDTAFRNPYQKVFLYVSFDKKICGCCVAEPIKEGFRVIPGDMDSSSASGRRPWCCDKTPEPALLGISRLWVAASSRRSGVATRLVDSVRQWFDYGSLIEKQYLAFSDPTPDGRRFAEKYFGTPAFLVYKHR